MSEKTVHDAGALGLPERLAIANAISGDSLHAVEKFHRASSLLRRSRFGRDLTAYHNRDVGELVGRRQSRLSETAVDEVSSDSARSNDVLVRGKSLRNFSPIRSLPYANLKHLLSRSFTYDATSVGAAALPYASAGAIYAVNAIIAPLISIEDAPFPSNSVLHLNALESKLYLLHGVSAENAAEVCLDCKPGAIDNSYANAVLMLIYVIDLELSTVRYGERGYRFSHIEAGLMAQQATLVGNLLGLGTGLFGGFPDSELAAVLDLNPRKMLPCLVQFFGKPNA